MSLFEKYKHATRVIVGFMSAVFVYIMTVVYPHAIKQGSSNASLAVFVLTYSGIYTLFYILAVWLYETVGWKLVHRRDNYSGSWEEWITYEFLERRGRSCREDLTLPFTFYSVFKIEQTATSLRFPEGYSAPNEVWKDRTSRLTADGIDMSYEVTRADKTPQNALPPQTYGFEIIRVTEFDRWGRPSTMAGTLYHAALPDINLFRGRTLYKRISSKKYARLLKNLNTGQAP